MSVNKVILLGNVGRDPEVRESGSGKFATFSLATTDRGYTTKDGVQVPERTEWHNIVVNGRLVGVVESFVHKGTQVYCEGKLRTRKYTDRNGQEQRVTEIVLNELELLGKPGGGNGNNGDNGYRGTQNSPRIMVNAQQAPPPTADDLPFGDAPKDDTYLLW